MAEARPPAAVSKISCRQGLALALALADIPESMLVLGGGYLGLELGTVYAALGSRISLVELEDRLLMGVDKDLVQPLYRRLEGVKD